MEYEFRRRCTFGRSIERGTVDIGVSFLLWISNTIGDEVIAVHIMLSFTPKVSSVISTPIRDHGKTFMY